MAGNTTSNDKSKQGFDDLQHEMSGVDNGRMKRFLPENSQSLEAKRKEKERQQFHSRLMQMLQDPAYKVRYEFTMDRLGEAERAADTTLATLGYVIEQTEQELQNIKENAARLPDGTRVYRDEQGNIRREDGSVVEDDLVATILWQGNEPSYEAFTNTQEKLSSVKEQYEDTHSYRNDVLGGARNRLEDEDSPPSLDDLDGILNDIDANMPDIIEQHISQKGTAISPNAEISINVVPEIPIKP